MKLRIKVFGDSPELSPKFEKNTTEGPDEKWFLAEVKERFALI